MEEMKSYMKSYFEIDKTLSGMHDKILQIRENLNRYEHEKNEQAIDSYHAGFNKAWELAKRIVLPEHVGGISADNLRETFGTDEVDVILYAFEPDVIRHLVRQIDEVKVGDEIQIGDDTKVVVMFKEPCSAGVINEKKRKVETMDLHTLRKGKKTGRRFPQVTELLRGKYAGTE